MNNTDASHFPIWVPFFAVGLWLLISTSFAVTSGWVLLARQFRANFRPEGRKFRGQVKRMGFVPENRVTHLIVSDHGLYLYASIPFRFMRPALLIPWSEVRVVRRVKTLWWYTYDLDLGSITRLRVTRRAYDGLQVYVEG